MDMSVIEGEEKPSGVHDVPEYAAEIHTYLREMEARNFSFLVCLVLYFPLDAY